MIWSPIRTCWRIIPLVLVVLLGASAGCGQPEVGSIVIRPSTPLAPGQSATLSIEISSLPATGVVQWSTTKGTFTEPTDSASTIFRAPSEPGPLAITCLVTWGGRTAHRSLAVDVVQAPSAMPGAPAAADPPAPSPAAAEILPRPYEIDRAGFVPSGWMGDGERGTTYVQVSRTSAPDPTEQWTYRPGPAGWAAVAYQYPENNWGDRKGKDLTAGGFRRVVIRARGAADGQGRFPRVQFKAGGHTSPAKRFQASFQVDGDVVTLTAEWKEFTLDLRGRDLSNVAAAFVWVARAADNPSGATFQLARIRYE